MPPPPLRRLRDAFERPGGQALRQWINHCENARYSALTFAGLTVSGAHFLKVFYSGNRRRHYETSIN